MSKELRFINPTDAFAEQINHAANELYHQIRHLDVDALSMDIVCRNYFKDCHAKRLIFSMRCSAAIIHDSVKLTGQPVENLVFLDYGAGLGTLFMLAAKLPFREVLYNDHLKEWCESAEVICKTLKIPIRHFIKGDIDDLVATCNSIGIKPDIIASRNVLEHIYNLDHFYHSIRSFNPACLVYSTTTANFQNPFMRIKHVFYHRKVENKWHKAQRRNLILEMYPAETMQKVEACVKATRGKARTDFTQAVHDFMNGKTVSQVPHLGSNTVDASNGVWAEHLLSRKVYGQIIERNGFVFGYTPGFWDEDYKSSIVNFFAKTMQGITRLSGTTGVMLSPFVNVIAKPNHF